MKLKNLLPLFFTFLIITSCSKENKMKKDFKNAYTSIMKDGDSYELVSFEIFQNAHEFSKENKSFLNNYGKLKNHKHRNWDDVYDSLYKIEENNNPKFLYTGALFKIKGTNSFGAKITSEHVAYYLGDNLVEIDGDKVIGNLIMRGY